MDMASGDEISATVKKIIQMVIPEIPFIIYYYFMVQVLLTWVQLKTRDQIEYRCVYTATPYK